MENLFAMILNGKHYYHDYNWKTLKQRIFHYSEIWRLIMKIGSEWKQNKAGIFTNVVWYFEEIKCFFLFWRWVSDFNEFCFDEKYRNCRRSLSLIFIRISLTCNTGTFGDKFIDVLKCTGLDYDLWNLKTQLNSKRCLLGKLNKVLWHWKCHRNKQERLNCNVI